MRYKKFVAKLVRKFFVEIRILCWEILRRLRSSLTVSTKQGRFTINLGKEDYIGRDLYANGEYELEVVSATMDFLRSIGKCPPKGEGTVVDIGANIGVISIGLLHTGECHRAIAIEPEPRNVALIERNVRQNGLQSKYITLPFAASNQRGELVFELSDDNFGDHRVRTDTMRNNGQPPTSVAIGIYRNHFTALG
jgi:hypothetical protein